MSSILIRGGRVIDPSNRIDAVLDVMIDGDRILAVGRDLSKLAGESTEIIKTKAGTVVTPGFVDPHVHFREPGTEGETIASGVNAAVAGGYTTVCVMPNTNPAIDSNERVAWQRERAAAAGKARVLVMGALTDGRAGRKPSDVAGMARAGGLAGLSDDGSGVQDAAVMLECMKRAADFGFVVSDHAEDSCLSGCGLIHEGDLSRALGLPGKPSISEWLMVSRDLMLAREAGCRLHIAHASVSQTLSMIAQAKLLGRPVTVEVAPHHIVFDDFRVKRSHDGKILDAPDPDAKMNPPLRPEKDRLALLEGIASGLVDAIATDHAPHPAAKKALGIKDAPNGVIGLETTFPVLNRLLVGATGLISLSRLVELLTIGPARCFDMNAGTLSPGAPADVTIIDIEERWTIDASRFVSQSRNSPFVGMDAEGRVVTTIVGGKIVYRHQESA